MITTTTTESIPSVDQELVVPMELNQKSKSSGSSFSSRTPPPDEEIKEKPKRRKRRARSTPNGLAHLGVTETPIDPKLLGVTAPHLIWVPAHKHPQIAPNEFAAWIKNYTQVEPPSAAQPNLRRQKSMLSSTFTPEDTESDSGSGSTVNVDRTHVFDRFSSAEDNSHVLVPHTSRSLSRRSALSARGKQGHQQHRRSLSTTDSQKLQDTPEEPIPIGGIQLYDRPVNMNEWIDLGDAMEDNSAMLTRVHDVETQVWTKSPEPPSPKELCSPPPPPPLPYHQESEKKQTNSIRKSLSVRRKKSTGWLVNLFQDISKKSGNQPQQQGTENEPKKQGLGSLIKRSLSLKSSVKKKKRPDLLHSSSTPPVPTIPNLFAGRERLPLHIERAIYHLSLVKLSNPRRPISQQVVISNFMFWYLSLHQPLPPPIPHSLATALPPPPPPPPPHRLNPHYVLIAPKSTVIRNSAPHSSPAYILNAN